MTAFVDALSSMLPQDCVIDVVTTAPNRYSSYSADFLTVEKVGNVNIHRIEIPQHKSGMVDQSFAYLRFMYGVFKYIKGKKYDLVFGSSSRLMTAFSSALIATFKGSMLCLDIRDPFVDTIVDVLPKRFKWALKYPLSCIERWAFSRAGWVNLVSPGFVPYYLDQYPSVLFKTYTNGIDAEFMTQGYSSERSRTFNKGNILTILYAGNIGYGQGLDHIIPEMAIRLRGKAVIKIIGDGGRSNCLLDALQRKQCDNVLMIKPLSRTELLKEYQDADVLFLHLNNLPVFLKALPSKIFEYAALGKPILAGVEGYPAEFINNNITNAQVFEPCNSQAALDGLDCLEIANIRRDEFINQFSREKIMTEMAKDVMLLVNSRS
ncbi:glycosyltransferase family 4 protein [Neptuniibacter sp. 1_MG-2023]|jgi:glycosyltransferase involved in cell wall biosynthesis|uniref:glycosyltransferase family 4 protein n=1 Tax=Neptuniibacter sp. 1_MG-2023 TaxID=3062662 RepID=UPI0026E41CFB|nr:glycosyltransferase family 4 protein [Neptuniibacter sp. 1_MG-2023]MDO6592766.1 glycosyltransferase family 4 protein [Neptuniibacter sp. 1_MG-2023]